MVQTQKKSRAEVEERLKQRSSSITSRLEAIESELPGPQMRIRNLIGKKNLVRAGVFVFAGVVTGIVFRRLRRDPKRAFENELDHVSSSIGKEISRNLTKGLPAQEAVAKALDKRPPIVNIGDSGGSFWSSLLSQLSRQVAAALGPVIADKIAARFKGESDEK